MGPITELKTTPVLVATASKGNRKYWQGFVFSDVYGHYYIQTRYWHETSNGLSKVQLSAGKIVKGKNIGRANETLPADQANLELDAMYRKQLDKNYVPEGEGEVKAVKPPILPMLAHKYADKGKSLTFPVFVQVKENGFRCLWDGENFWSRQGKILNVEATNHLRFDAHGCVYDGELVLPAPHTFQQTCSAIKKFDSELSPQLEYRIYDLYDPNDTELPYHKRHDRIWSRCFSLPEQVVLVDTATVGSERLLLEVHAAFVAEGHEGSIVRTFNGTYKAGHRSADLLKLKDFLDAEFEIVGFTDGRGKDEGAVIFTCVTESGKTFDVRPEGSLDDRRRMFRDGESYIGKPLTVRYQTLTDGGLPLFPVAVAVRDYED